MPTFVVTLNTDSMKEKTLRIRISENLKASVYKIAQSKGMSISEFVRYVLQKEVEK